MHSEAGRWHPSDGRRLTEVVASTAARVEARLNELKAEVAQLRGFVETVASQNGRVVVNAAAAEGILNDLIAEALKVLAEID